MNKRICAINLILLGSLIAGCATTMPTTPLLDATSQGDKINVESLLDNGADINAIGGRDGETPLMLASKKGNLEIVQLLIDKGAEVNARGAYGDTALIAAAWGCQRNTAEYLIKNGAQVNVKNENYGSTALNVAAEKCNDRKFIRLLLDNGADIHIRNDFEESPYVSAVRVGHLTIVNMLLEAGADINESSSDFTALMIAVLRGNQDIVSLLIDKKVDLNAINDFNQTALDIARAEKKTYIAGLLERAGAIEAPPVKTSLPPVNALDILNPGSLLFKMMN